jgi:AcrR family transcriptional regulator
MNDSQGGLRERTRRAVQQEITDAAQRLFLEKGYEATTVDDIAEAVGMSRRSFHRYFANKEDVVVGKFDLVADEMLNSLTTRPTDEPVWESLRRLFDLLVDYVDAPGKPEIADPMQRIVFTTPGLLASYLEKLHRMQDAAEQALRGRAERAGTPYAADDPTPRAIVGAAFGCLIAAQHAWLANGGQTSFAATIDRAMTTVSPAPVPKTRRRGTGR